MNDQMPLVMRRCCERAAMIATVQLFEACLGTLHPLRFCSPRARAVHWHNPAVNLEAFASIGSCRCICTGCDVGRAVFEIPHAARIGIKPVRANWISETKFNLTQRSMPMGA